ncbi:MAG: hypothetical protein WD035_07565 [Balneolaceae bacterium]
MELNNQMNRNRNMENPNSGYGPFLLSPYFCITKDVNLIILSSVTCTLLSVIRSHSTGISTQDPLPEFSVQIKRSC